VTIRSDVPTFSIHLVGALDVGLKHGVLLVDLDGSIGILGRGRPLPRLPDDFLSIVLGQVKSIRVFVSYSNGRSEVHSCSDASVIFIAVNVERCVVDRVAVVVAHTEALVLAVSLGLRVIAAAGDVLGTLESQLMRLPRCSCPIVIFQMMHFLPSHVDDGGLARVSRRTVRNWHRTISASASHATSLWPAS